MIRQGIQGTWRVNNFKSKVVNSRNPEEESEVVHHKGAGRSTLVEHDNSSSVITKYNDLFVTP